MVLCSNSPSKKDSAFAWIVLVASFLILMMIDGVLSAYGLIYPALTEEYKNTTSWQLILPGSLQSGFFLLTGSVTAALVNRMGMHVIATSGALISCLSLLSSAFITNLSIFTCMFGVCTGIGFNFMLVPAIVAVNLYFERLRPLANGFAMTGSGIGYIVLPLFTKFLLEIFEWRDCVKIISSLLVICIISSLCLRPFVEVVYSVCNSKDGQGDDVAEKQPLELNTPDNKQRTSVICDQIPIILVDPSDSPSVLKKKNFSSMPTVNHWNYASAVNFISEIDLNKSHAPTSLNMSVVKPLSRKDIFYSGHIGEVMSDRSENKNKLDTTQDNISEKFTDKGCLSDFLVTFDFALFGEWTYILLVFIALFLQISYFIPFVYLNDYASRTRNLSGQSLLYLALVLGVSSTIGRATGGLLANVKRIHPFHLSFVSICLCGVSCMCVPLCINADLLMVYAAVHGFNLAIAVVLQPLLLVQYVGINRLTAAIGNMTMLKGLASFIGTPVAAVLFDSTGNYNSVFLWAGGCFFAALLLHVPLYMTLCRRKENLSSEDIFPSTFRDA